jgi:hypothetical protein
MYTCCYDQAVNELDKLLVAGVVKGSAVAPGAGKGIAVAIVNVVLIGICFGLSVNDSDVVLIVIVYGMIPGVVVGTVLGVVAHIAKSLPVVLRVAILTIPSVTLVGLLGWFFHMEEMIPFASIPSIISSVILERWTRKITPPLVPVAQVAKTS